MKRYFGQGVVQVVRFNWPMYVVAFVMVLAGWLGCRLLPGLWSLIAGVVACVVALLVFLSLAATCYAYDLTGLYDFEWLDRLHLQKGACLVNIHAGFDESSGILAERFPDADLKVFDFYDPDVHTEPSIERARNLFPPYPGTRRIDAGSIPLGSGSATAIFVLFAAHEIRNPKERSLFFREAHRVLAEGGRVFVLEHLRDLPNAIAYHFGVFHFHPREAWLLNFREAGLKVEEEVKLNHLMTLFKLSAYGNTD